MVKTNKDYCKSRKERGWVENQRCSKKKIRARKEEIFRRKKHDEFKKKEAVRIKEYRLKKKLTEYFACDSQREQKKNDHPLHHHFLQNKSWIEVLKRQEDRSHSSIYPKSSNFYLFKRSEAFESATITNLALNILLSPKRPCRCLQIV